jgi:hypothetical protein
VAQTLPRIFLHSYRSDGTVSSICRRCQVTVAIKPNEIELRMREGTHVCSNLDLSRLSNRERLTDAKE